MVSKTEVLKGLRLVGGPQTATDISVVAEMQTLIKFEILTDPAFGTNFEMLTNTFLNQEKYSNQLEKILDFNNKIWWGNLPDFYNNSFRIIIMICCKIFTAFRYDVTNIYNPQISQQKFDRPDVKTLSAAVSAVEGVRVGAYNERATARRMEQAMKPVASKNPTWRNWHEFLPFIVQQYDNLIKNNVSRELDQQKNINTFNKFLLTKIGEIIVLASKIEPRYSINQLPTASFVVELLGSRIQTPLVSAFPRVHQEQLQSLATQQQLINITELPTFIIAKKQYFLDDKLGSAQTAMYNMVTDEQLTYWAQDYPEMSLPIIKNIARSATIDQYVVALQQACATLTTSHLPGGGSAKRRPELTELLKILSTTLQELTRGGDGGCSSSSGFGGGRLKRKNKTRRKKKRRKKKTIKRRRRVRKLGANKLFNST